MKAYILKEPGNIKNMILSELPVPIPASDEVLIKTKAIRLRNLKKQPITSILYQRPLGEKTFSGRLMCSIKKGQLST